MCHWHGEISSNVTFAYCTKGCIAEAVLRGRQVTHVFAIPKLEEAQWPIGYGVGLRIKRSSVRIQPWPLRWVLGQGSLLPLSQGEAFTLASISYLAILVKYILAKKKKFIYRTFPYLFLHKNSQRGWIKGKKVRFFKCRHTQSTSTMEASIARKWTRLGRRVLRHQLAQVCSSSCIMSCFSCAAIGFRYSKRSRIFFT